MNFSLTLMEVLAYPSGSFPRTTRILSPAALGGAGGE